MLVRVDVNHPAALVDLYYSADDDVSNVGPVALPQRSNANDPVDLVHDTSH